MRQFFTTVLTTLFSLFFAFNALADTNPKREFRSTWYCSVYNFEFGSSVDQSGMLSYIQKAKEANIHAIAFQVRPMGDAIYKSTLNPAVPWSQYASGTRGTAPSWDPLEYFVTQCHNLGIEAHVWINPYRMPVKTSWGVNTAYDTWVSNNGWLWEYKKADTDTYVQRILNPGIPDVRKHIADVIGEIVTKYDIDGVLFDDYFYQQWLSTYDNVDDAQYSQYGNGMTRADWRRDNVNKMVQLVYDRIKSIKKYVRFGIGPAGVCGGPNGESSSKYGIVSLSKYCSASDWQYNGIYSDPLAWLSAHSIDYLTPQVYWEHTHATNPYKPIMQWYDVVAKAFGRPVFSSNNAYELSTDEIGAQIATNRTVNTDGQPGAVLYRVANQLSSMGNIATQFQYKSLPPAMTWYSASDPGKISSLTKSGSTLTCSSLGSNVRYVFYAVPTSVNRRQATSDQGGLKAEYIVDMSYTNSVSISGKTSGYWYAVAPLDRYGNEWTLTTLNETINEYTDKANPISPVNGAEFKPQTIALTFKKVDVDSYKIVVAKDASFSNVIFNQTITPTATADGNWQYSYNATSLTDGTYYWKVVTNKTSFLETSSDVANFVISTVSDPCAAVELVSPISGEEFTLQNIEMEFKPVDADKYVLHVAMNEDFTYRTFDSSKDPLVKDNGNLYFTGPISVFPDGTYFWKIETSKVGYYNNTSVVGTFTVKRPTWTAPALLSPAKAAEISEDVVTFVAQDVYADSYKLEVSLYSDFSTVLYSSTSYTISNSQVKFNAKNIGLVNTKTHYWRVTATKGGGYHDGVSAVSNFKVVLPSAPVSTIYYPENGFEFNNSDVVICASNPANANSCTLQIATDEDFNDIVYSTNTYTLVDNDGGPQYIIPIADVKPGTYFFRVVTTASGLDDGISEVRYYTVINDTYMEGLVTDVDYQLIRSGAGYYKFTNLWLKSQNKGNDLVSTGNTTQYHRDFDVRSIDADGKGYVMVTYSSANNSGATTRFEKYEAATGEQLLNMEVSYDNNYNSNCGGYSKLNNISVDAGGNVLISNCAVSASTLKIGKYNTSTGAVSHVYSYSNSTRVDHTFVYGNYSGTMYVFIPISSGTTLYRLTFKSGSLSKTESMTVNNTGTAPRMFIVDKDHFFLDGTNGYPEYYTWGNSTPSGVFNDANSSLEPSASGNNGMGYVELGVDKFLIYCYQGYGTSVTENQKDIKFRIAKGDNLPSSYSGLSEMWTFPEDGLGKVIPGGGDKGTIVRVAKINSNLAYIYVFAPNNGLAAYKLEYVTITGVDRVFTDDYKPELVGGELSFGFAVDNVAVFNSAGILVANEQDVASCTLPDAKGIYIVVARKGDEVKTFKFIR